MPFVNAQLAFDSDAFLFTHPDEDASYSYPILPFDYNADGEIDFSVPTFNEQYVFINDGTNNFSGEVYQTNRTLPLKNLDFDNDGDLDIIGQERIHIRELDGTYSIVNPVGVFRDIIEAEDLNGDGFVDLLSVESEAFSADKLYLSFNLGNGEFSEELLATHEDFDYTRILDLDGDGDLDIFCTLNDTEDALILTNLGDGTFEPLVRDFEIGFGFQADIIRPLTIDFADFDCDNDMDLIWSSWQDKFVFHENVDNFSEDGEIVTLEMPQSIYMFRVGDLNNTGYPDILFISEDFLQDRKLYSVENLGGYTFGQATLIDDIADPSGSVTGVLDNGQYAQNNIHILDIDQDNFNDIIYVDGFAGNDQVVYYKNISNQPECVLGDRLLSSQDEIDAFFNQTSCSNIRGNITISGEDITNLSGLASLSQIDGCLTIEGNPQLTSLEGLENLTGLTLSLTIADNPLLSSIGALSNTMLTFVNADKLTIVDNPLLEVCHINSICSFLQTIESSENANISANQPSCADAMSILIACSGAVDNDNDGFSEEEDCDDNNAAVNPGATEIPYNGLDDDCNEVTLDDDLDQDGFDMVDDCNDNDAAINPNAEDIPNNGIDEDCDGMDATSTTHNLAGTTITLYPNPATEIVQIITDHQGQLSYVLSALDGRVLKSGSIVNSITTLDVTTLQNGLYLLWVKNDQGESVLERIVVD